MLPQYVADVIHVAETVFIFTQKLEIPDLAVLMGAMAAMNKQQQQQQQQVGETNKPCSSWKGA